MTFLFSFSGSTGRICNKILIEAPSHMLQSRTHIITNYMETWKSSYNCIATIIVLQPAHHAEIVIVKNPYHTDCNQTSTMPS